MNKPEILEAATAALIVLPLLAAGALSGHLAIEIEKRYIRSLGGINPDPEVCGEISSRQFTTLIESPALLFSSRLPNETHIFAGLMLDAETANCYFRGRGKAEATLTYFSWKWRFFSDAWHCQGHFRPRE